MLRAAVPVVAVVAALAVARVGGPAPASAGPAADADVDRARETLARNARDPFQQRTRTAALRDLGRAGGVAAAELACSCLGDPFAHVRDHAVSALIDMLRGARADETRAWLVERALVDRAHPEVRRGVATALGVRGGTEAAAALAAAAAKEGDPTVLEALAHAVLRCGDGGAASALRPAADAKDGAAAGAVLRALGRISKDADVVATLRRGLARKEPLARAGAVDGLAAADSGALVAAADPLVADKAIEPRIALADALPGLAQGGERAAAIALLARLLADPSWRVRAAAIEAAIGVWDRAAVPLLVERLRAETGRLVFDAVRALEQLTGEAVGRDPDLWAGWWATKGPTFELPARPAPDRFGRVRRERTAPRPRDDGDTKTAAFYRLPLASARLAFLFDFSGSMRDAAEGGGTGTKADVARREFERAVAALRKDTVFDLFIYRYPSEFPPAPRSTRALGALSPAGPATARKAVDWLAKELPKGWGAFYDGLVACAAEEVDTIVLLSDGVPSMGTYDRDFRLLDEWARANRFRRVAVDTVLVGTKGTDRRFLEDLADVSGGRFQDGLAR